MNSIALFTDVSLNPRLRLGIGGYLLLPLSLLASKPHAIVPSELSARLQTRRFRETSSTKLELQTLLWALENSRQEISATAPGSLQIYTDSQCVAGLLGRRAGLITCDFVARRSGRPLANAVLYRAFYEAHEQLDFQLHKVAGHSPAGTHDTVRRIFAHVDREVRKALDLWLARNPRPELPDGN
jgi:ribonuclease HI